MEISHPTPRNIGRINTHNTNPIVEPMRITNTLTTFFIWLKPEVEVLPRLFDMLLFVFIVRHFFICISTIGFSLLDTHRACEASEGCSPFDGKIRVQNEYSPELAKANTSFCVWRFFSQKAKEYPGPHTLALPSKLKSVCWYCNETGDKTPHR